jgi:hypothetical protein
MHLLKVVHSLKTYQNTKPLTAVSFAFVSRSSNARHFGNGYSIKNYGVVECGEPECNEIVRNNSGGKPVPVPLGPPPEPWHNVSL